jgi:uncharacterized membrane protein
VFSERAERVQQVLRVLIAISFAAFGIQHLFYRDFVTRIVPRLPAWIPWHPFWAGLTGVALVAGAIALVMKKRGIVMLMGWVCLAAALSLHLPLALASPHNAGLWVWFGKGLTLSGTAFIAAGSLTAHDSSLIRERLILFGKYSLAGFMIYCGYLHFVLVAFVASLIPSWIPWHHFWTYFAGVALIAGGVGMVVPITTRLASFLSGTMVLAWVPLVHIPRALANLSDANETTSAFEALAFGSVAVLAALAARRSFSHRTLARRDQAGRSGTSEAALFIPMSHNISE